MIKIEAIKNKGDNKIIITNDIIISIARLINNWLDQGLVPLKLLAGLGKRFELSARGMSGIIKVARTIADLAKSRNIREEHVLEAASYRKAGVYG